MRKFLITLNIVTNAKKIDAIKTLRTATGMGLGESKTFVETTLGGFMDSFGGDLIVNESQLANLLMLEKNPLPAHDNYTVDPSWNLRPTFTIDKVQEVTHNGIDISSYFG